MISISPTTYDLSGSLMLTPTGDSAIQSADRRVSRSATLDGGVAIYDGGYADGDRTFQIAHRQPTRAQVDRAAALCRDHTELTIAAPDGCYSGVIERYSYADGVLSLTLLISARRDTL